MTDAPTLRPDPECDRCRDTGVIPHWDGNGRHDTPCGCGRSPEPDEPRDVRVARALGLNPRHGKRLDNAHRWYCDWPQWRAGGTAVAMREVPDFSRDPAFILRMIDANHLSKTVDVEGYNVTGHRVWNAFTHHELCEGRGKNTAEAVISWLLAAHAAGVKIRTEVER